MAEKVRRGQVSDACPDERDPRSLPLLSAENAYGGRGAALTAVVVDGDRAWFDEAALHGRTALEQGLTWVKDPAEVPGGRRINPVWVYIRPAGGGSFRYYGLNAAEMWVDPDQGVGFKRLGDHVNRLSKTMEGKVDLSLLDDTGRAALVKALAQYPEVLANSSPEVKAALGLEPGA